MATLLLLVVSVALLVSAVLLARSRNSLPWPGIGVAALACAICFTVGGATGQNLTGPDPATVSAAFSGVLTVAASILALVPRDSPQPSRLPMTVATLGIVVGAIGLVLNQLTS